MRKIAEAIEYSPTAIYLHFKDKDALVRELCLEDFDSLAKAFQRIAPRTGPARAAEEVRPRLRRLRPRAPEPLPPDVHDAPPGAAKDEEAAAKRKGNPEADAYAFLVATVAEAIEKGLLRPELKDPHLVAQAAWAGVHGVVSLHVAKGTDGWLDWKPLKKTVDARRRVVQPRDLEVGPAMVSLARRNLFHDKLRFAITIAGVAFAVTLVFVQVGLFLGLLDNASITIENIDADLWVTSRNTPNVDFSQTFPETYVQRVRSVPGVARADNLIVWFMQHEPPEPARRRGRSSTPSRTSRRWNLPWNVTEGRPRGPPRGDFFFLDDSADAPLRPLRRRASTARSPSAG